MNRKLAPQMKRYKQFLRNSAGNVGIFLSIVAVPLLLGTGVAVDMVRASRTQAVLQAATDAAALAGAVADKSADEIKVIAEEFIDANGGRGALDQVSEVKVNDANGTFSVSIKGKIKTTFMGLAGVSTMDIDAFAEVTRGSTALEVALVLDNTDSMNEEGRLDALKASARNLVEQVFDNAPDGAYTRIGLVPFANYVNVGLSARTKSYMSVPADSSSVTNQCIDTYPDATRSNCRNVPYTYTVDGIEKSATSEQCDWDYGAAVNVCSDVTTDISWYGCVGSRNSPLDREIGSPNVRYPGIMAVSCPSEIVDLTNDDDLLKGKIGGLVATGNTYIPAGLLWGWNMLDPAEPLTSAKSKSEVAALQGHKAIVLMTDGENTLVPSYPEHVPGPNEVADPITLQLCSNIKADGITIYTVAFKVTDTDALDNLRTCASDTTKAFDADSSSELSAAFEEIAQKLSAVRLSK